MKRILVILACVLLNGCIFLGVRAVKAIMPADAEEVSGSASGVVVKAANDADPASVAAKHCSKFGKSAVPLRSEPDGDGRHAIYFYACS